MAEKKLTVYQKLQKVLAAGSVQSLSSSNSYNIHQPHSSNDVVDIARTPQEKDFKILQAKQQKLMARQWYRAQQDINNQSLAGLNDVRLMYRDVDLMDTMPEIGTAMDIVSEESCYVGESGSLINISSGSERVKGILQDLFVNRLCVNTTLPMIARSMIKYGNDFHLLHTDAQLGVLGWKELPVYELERYENGMEYPYTHSYSLQGKNVDEQTDETRFVWVGQGQSTEYRNWQIAHFRLLYDSSMLPYGCIVGDSRIETENGYKEIQNIVIGDKVWTFNTDTHKRELSTVTMTMNKGEKPVYKLKTKHYSIEGTSDHKILTCINGELLYKEIGELQKGDLIVCNNSIKNEYEKIEIDKSELKDYELLGKSSGWWDQYIDNVPNIIDEEFAQLFGFLLGDGWISHGYHVMFALGEHKSINDKYISIIKKLSGKEIRFVKNINEKRKLQFNTAFVGSKMLVTILKRMGFNGDAYTKRIPSWVFKTNKCIRESFLNGLIDADGSLKIVSDKSIAYTVELANEQLVKDIKTLALSLGYKVGQVGERNRIGYKSQTITEKPIVATHKSYYVSFYKSQNEEFACNKKIEWKEDGFILEKVKSVVPIGIKETYDITVENNNSNFFANNIVTHNCSYLHKARRHFRMLSMMEDMMFIYRLDRSIERRVFKINVGAIDEADVPAYVQQIADNFKRTPIIDPMTGQIDLRKNIMPVWKKTPIPLLDGRTITIEDLAKEYENGKINYVYSVQDNTKQIVPGKVVWCGKNYTAKQMVKITLDDDTYMVMAPEHEIVMRDGTKKRADKVVEGESIMPFYRDKQPLATKLKSEYETVYNPHSGKYEFTHRLVGKSLQKQEGETVIHHKDFNRKNNSPENLQWMTWKDHKDLHVSMNNNPIIQQKRRETKTELWRDAENREKYCQNMTVNFDDYVWNKIENAIAEGLVYSQKMIVDYVNQNLIDYLIETNKSDKIKHNRKISKITVKSRVQSLGYKNCDEYINAIEEKYNLESHFDKLNKDKSERAKKYNLIENIGENVWFTDKAEEAKAKLSDSLRKNYFKLSDEIWDDINQNIIRKNINYVKDIVDFLNRCYISEIDKTNNDRFTSKIVERLIKRKGFDGISDYFSSIRKNHKIKSIEYIDGDDVYCMTVVGLNGEEDRHNFALQTFIDDNTYSNNGCFVSNCQTNDYFIPVREDSSSTPIENLPAGQNLTAMDDIKYVQNKIVTALRVPKSFLNFEEAAGDGKNLSLLDVRFMRTVNRIQQALLLELNKVAIIHLLMLGFTDELTNFTLSMANPSSQAEMLELENLAKKVTTAKDAVSDPGGGMPIASMTWAWRHIFKWSDKEIQQNLEELRLETALAAELQQTNQIIKRTRLFDPVDNIYGEVGAEYGNGGQQGDGQDNGMGGGAGGGGGMPMGGDMDFGDEGEGMDMGDEGEMDMGAAADENAAMGGAEPPAGGDEGGGAPNLGEMITRQMKKKINEKKVKLYTKSESKKLIAESQKRQKSIMEEYLSLINKDSKVETPNAEIYDRAFFMNEEMNDMVNKLGNVRKEKLID